MTITAAADGSSLSNPGPAGWAWYIDDDRWHAGGWPHGTNNMGELMAVLDLLRQTAGDDDDLLILCDSQYVINSVTKWMPGWKKKGWKKADGKPVLNVELLQELDVAMRGREVRFEWVKGHAGHELNEAADNRARAAATAYRDHTTVHEGPGYSPVSHASAGSQAMNEKAREEAEQAPPGRRRQATTKRTATSSQAADPADAAGSSAPRGVTAADLDEVVELEQALLSDHVRATRALSDALLHPEFAEIGSSGRVWDRDAMLDSMAPLGSRVDVEVIDCSAVGSDAILLLWRASGRAWSVHRSSLWLRTAAGWQLRFHQGTRAN